MKVGLEWLSSFVEVNDPEELVRTLSLKSVEASLSRFSLGFDARLENIDGVYIAKVGDRAITYKDLGFGSEEVFCFRGEVGSELLSKALGENELILEIDPTPNRGDLLSVYGLAREIAALTDADLKEIEIQEIEGNTKGLVNVESQDCEIYIGALIEDLKVEASPLWLVKRLLQAGIRPINTLVDITNYVMLLTGQPLHAFDLDKLRLPLYVKSAKDGEVFVSLSGEELKLSEENLVIADEDGVKALAGIVGGLNSSVDKSTKRCFLEGAYFSPRRIRRSLKAADVRTESSYRFERGVDKRGLKRAFSLALELIRELCGARVVGIEVIDKGAKERVITLSLEKLKTYVGREVKAFEVSKALKRLGFNSLEEENTIRATVPSWRQEDVKEDVDLIEEFMRLEGFDKFEKRGICVPIFEKDEDLIEELRDRLTALGLYEVINFSFESADIYQALGIDIPKIEIVNPLVKSVRFLRSHIITGLLKTYAYNQSRHNYSLAIFELDNVFRDSKELLAVGFLISGERGVYPAKEYDHWHALEIFQEILKFTEGLEISRDKLGFLHPGVQAVYKKGDEVYGFVGMLNPKVAKNLELRGDIYIGELLLEKIVKRKPITRKISSFAPAVRDISIVVDRELEVSKLVNLVLEFEEVEEVKVFDIYLGIGEGKKSVGLRVRFRDLAKTLSDEEVNAVVGKMLSLLEERFGARLR